MRTAFVVVMMFVPVVMLVAGTSVTVLMIVFVMM